MGMASRKYQLSAQYKYGFNGKENDKETVGTGEGTQDYGMRIYNPALGRFLSVDPLTKKYPELTPYQFASNRPIVAIDLDGLEAIDTKTGATKNEPYNQESLEAQDKADYSAWEDLISLSTPKSVFDDANKRMFGPWAQPISEAYGDELNLDYYAVTIDKLPPNMTVSQMYDYIRVNLNNFLKGGGTLFEANSKTEQKLWESTNPTSAVMRFEVTAGFSDPNSYTPNLEEMAVITNKSAINYWVFTPVTTLDDLGHPLAGNRQFGLTTNTDSQGKNTYTFFTRGVDRPWGGPDVLMSGMIFLGAEVLWKTTILNVINYINNNGGSAYPNAYFAKRISWEKDYLKK
jgi:RHS repeat-associated protein